MSISIKMDDVPPYEALVNALNRAKLDPHHKALLAVLIYTGCRLGEALNLKLKDLDKKRKTITIRQEKKSKPHPRVIPVPSRNFWNIINEYLRKSFVRDRLFEMTDRNARQVIYNFSKKYLKRRIRPHAIRHSYATFLMKKTKDLELVRRMLGHSDYKVVRAYMNYTQEDLEEELTEIFEEIEK